MSRKIELVYFKKSGKYYSESSYMSEFYNDYEVYVEVGTMWKFPGLSGGWEGTILVQPEDGVPALITAKRNVECES